MFLHTAIGATVSRTVTVELQTLKLPLTSVTFSVTRFAPTLEQVKVFGATDKEAISQLSKLPLSTLAGVIEALPVASSCMVISLQIGVGRVVSTTVMI